MQKNSGTCCVRNYVMFLSKHRKKLLPLVALTAITMLIGAFQIAINLNTDAFLFKSDENLKIFREYQYIFGSDDVVIAAVKGDVFSNEYLNKIDKLQKEIEARVPYIDKSTSIINVSQIYTEGDTLYVDDLLKEFPDKQLSNEALKNLQEVVLNDPVFRDRTVSTDGKYSTIVVEFLSPVEIDRLEKQENESVSGEGEDGFDDFDDLFAEDGGETEQSAGIDSFVDDEDAPVYLSIRQSNEVFNAIQEIRKEFEADDFHIAMVGSPLMIPSLLHYLIRDLIVFFPILIVFILVCTRLMFRRASAVVLCFAVAGITNLFIIGLMGWTGVPLTMLTNVVPLIMFTMSLGAVIHLLTLIYRKFDENETMEDAISYGISHSGWPIILTSLTSAAGIFSFYFSTVKPMRDFAVFGAIGLTVSLILTLVFVPLLMLQLPIERVSLKIGKNSGHTAFDNVLRKISIFSFKYRIITFIATLLIVVVAILGIQKVYFSHQPTQWLPKDAVFRQDSVEVDRVLKGSNQMVVFIDTQKDGGVLEPEFLQKIESYEKKVKQYDDGYVKVGNVLSFVTMIKKTNESLAGSYSIPETKELIAQEVLLLENGGADVLSSMMDLNYRYMSITLTAPDLDAVHFTKLLEYSHSVLDELFADSDYEYHETGGIALLARTIYASIESAVSSYIIAFIVITILMIFLTRNIVVGLVSMIPNLLPLFFLLGIIGFTSINLDMFVLLIGSVLMGLAVDNTIHFIHVFRGYIDEGNSKQDAITNTFLSTGKAMFTASVILASGFAVFIFAKMGNFNSFGIMATIGIAVALFSDFFLTPALMSLLVKEKKDA